MSQNTKKPYDLPDWPAEAEQTQEASVPGVQPKASAIPTDALGAAALRCQPAAGDPAGPPQRAEPPHQQILRLV